MVAEEVEVGARAGKRVAGIGRADGDGLGGIGDDPHAERERRAGDRRHRRGRAGLGDTPGVRRLGAGGQRAGDGRGAVAGVVIVARHDGAREVGAGEIGRGEAAVAVAHRHDAERVVVGREGRTVRDGPAADQVVREVGRGERDAVDLRQEDVAVRREALAAEGVAAVAVIRGVAVEVDARMRAGAADEVADGQLHRAAHADVRQRVDRVGAALGGDGVERHDRVAGAAAVDRERAALEGDRVRRREARGRGVGRGVQAEVIPIEGAVEELESRRAGNRAVVAQLERAAADDRLADVGAGAGEELVVRARLGEGEVARELAGERRVGRLGGISEDDDRGAGVGDRAAGARQRVGAGERGDSLRVVLEVDHGGRAVEREAGETRAGRAGVGGDEQGVRRAGIEAQRAAVDDGRAGEVSLAVQVQDAAVRLEHAGGAADGEGRVEVERTARDDVDEGRRADRGRLVGADVDITRRTREHERGGGAGLRLRQETAVGAELAEGDGIEAGGQGRGAGDRERVGDGAGLDDLRRGEARVLRGRPGGDGRVELVRSERAIVVGGGILDQETRAETADAGVREDIVTDAHGRGAIGTRALTADKASRRDGQVGDAGRGGRAGDAADDQGAVAVARVQRRHRQRERLGGIRGQLDATAAVLHVEVGEGLGGRRGRIPAEDELTALDIKVAGGVQAEAIGHVGARVVELEDTIRVSHEGGSLQRGADEGLARTGILQRAAADDGLAVRGVAILGGVEREDAAAKLGQGRVEGVVEALEAAGERRGGAVEADLEVGRRDAAEDVAGAGERTPGGVGVIEVITRARRQGEAGEARAGVGHAVAEAAGRDGQAAGELRLGAELQHAVAGLGQAAGRTDDRLEGEARAQRIHVGGAVDVDRGDVDRVGGRTEVHAAFDDARGGDVLRRGDDAAGADREDATRAEAGGAVGGEGADDRRAAEVVELHARESVIAEEVKGAGAVDDDRVARGDRARGERGDVTAADAHARGRVGGQRDEARGGDIERALVDDRAAGVGVGRGQRAGVGAGLDERHRARAVLDDGVDGGDGAALGVEEELGAAGGQETLVDRRAEEPGVVGEAQEAARGERERLVRGDGHRPDRADARREAVDREVGRDRGGGGGDLDVVRRLGEGRDSRGRGVTGGAGGAQGRDAEAGDVGGEVAGADGGPAAEDAVREAAARRRGGHAADGGEPDARAAAGLAGRRGGEVDRGIGRTGQPAGDEVGGIDAGAAEDRVDEGSAFGQGHRTDRLGGRGLRAATELDDTPAERDRSGVVDAVARVAGAAGVLEIQATGVIDGDGRRRGERAVVAQQDIAAVDDGGARIRAVRIEAQVVQARAGQLRRALDRAGEIAAGVVVVDEQVARAGRARDDARGAADDAVAEEAIDHLAAAVEVQGAAVEREVIAGAQDVGEAGAGLQRAIVEHVLAVHAAVRGAGETVERGRHGGEGQRARAGLDDRHRAVGDAVATVDRRGDREVADGPEVERREAVGLIEQAAGDRRDAAGAHQDATGAEIQDDAGVEREIGVTLDGEGIRRDVRRGGGRARREQDVVIGRDRVDGRILVGGQRTEVGGRRGGRGGVAGGEGGAQARGRDVDERPRQDAFGRGRGRARLAVEAEAGRVLDGGDARTRGGAEGGATEEDGRRRGAGTAVLRVGLGAGGAGEHQVRLLAGLRGDGDDGEAAAEGRRGQGLERRAVGVADDVQRAALEIDVGSRAEAVVERRRAGVEHLEDGARTERVGLRRGGQDARAAEGDLAGVDDDAGVRAELGRLRGGDVQRARAVLHELIRSEADRAGQVDRAGDREDDLAAAGVVDAAGKREGGAGQGADHAVEDHRHRTAEGVAAGDAEDLAVAVEAAAIDFVGDIADHDRVGDGDVTRELQRRADGGVDHYLVRGEAGGRGIGQTHRAGVDDDAAGGDGPVRGRVGGRELEHAVVVLIKDGRGRGERERAVQGQDLAGDDFEGVVRLVEDEGAAGREGVDGAETRAGRTIDIDGHRVADGAQGGVGTGGEDAREDVDRTTGGAEGIGAREQERARAGLDQAVVVRGVIDGAREDEARLEIGSRGVGDGEVRRTGERGRPRELQAVAGEVGHAHDVARDGQVDLAEHLVAGERSGAGAIDGDGGIAGQREVAAEGDVLESAAGVAVRREHQAADGLERAGVVADDERAEAALVDDVGRLRRRGVRDRERHLRGDDLDVPGRRQGRDAVERQVVDAGEDMRADAGTIAAEGDIVADREGAGGTQAGAGGHRQRTKAKRTGKDRARDRRAVGADQEGARRDVDAAGEGAEAAQLQDAVARLGDAAVLDDGIDDQARLPRGEVLAVDERRADRDREGGGAIQVDIAGAKGRGRGGVDVHRRGHEAGRQGQRAGRDERR